MSENDIEPGHLPKLGTLNQIKYKASLNELKHSDPVTSLKMMMNDEYKNIITHIGLAPFFVIYCLPLQLEWYKQQFKTEGKMYISLDSSGSAVFAPINSLMSSVTEKLGHIFLYTIMAKDKDSSSVPVYQMLSQSHTSNFLSYWLGTWIQNVKIPSEVVTDDSAALLKSVEKSFTSKANTKVYIEHSFQYLDTNNNNFLPECFVRLDRSHFVKSIHRLPIFKYKDYRVVRLLKKCNWFSYTMR